MSENQKRAGPKGNVLVTLNKSILSLSMPKAGSSIADRIIMDILTAKGMEIDRIAEKVRGSTLSEREYFIKYQERINISGFYYGIARGQYVSEMNVLDKLKLIVQVRDPRDCLVSAYFSFKISHVAPKSPLKTKEFLARRAKLEKKSIDQYVLSQVGDYFSRLNVLKDVVARHDDVLVLKYEDMVERTELWLSQISDFVGQPITPGIRTAFGRKIDFSVPSEDATQHKRQVTPGDHLRKLSPDTIAELTTRLAPAMSYFGYS